MMVKMVNMITIMVIILMVMRYTVIIKSFKKSFANLVVARKIIITV